MKKIAVNDLKVGMYIHELCGSWMDHPFWKTSFLLDSHVDLVTLRKSQVRWVWIDPSKGLDVEHVEVLDVSETGVALEKISELQESPMPAAATSRATYDDEIENARRIYGRAKIVVTAMFREVRMGNILPVEQAYPVVEEIHRSVERNTDALISLVRLKTQDQYTYLHSVAVCALMIGLGKQLGLDGVLLRRVGVAGLFHDAGKMEIDEAVLNKPDRLTEAEFALIKTHPVLGHEMLQKAQVTDEIVLDVCLHHHERMDQNGYPDRLRPEELSLYVRMASICDVYDALTSDRCYKKGWEPTLAIHKMAEWQTGHFDEKIFHAFVRTVGIYPCGTLVRLKSGRLGYVVSQSERSLLTPTVRVFFSTRLNGRIPQEDIDLEQVKDGILCAEDPVKWGFEALHS
ncbi:MAG: HD-GYP domain-containing protein [Betaproteobacteria bacterium]|jgi:uncharacterized domain HDIG|nr:HD-GYP domain-containing protein [Betaproteobacteria bacterium]